MIIRREHNGNFTIVPNAIFNDRRLSIEAIGLLGYLLSRPPNWRARHGHLRKTLGMGRLRFERATWELMSAGYVERDMEQPRDGDNQFSSYNYVVRDVPKIAPADHPLPGFPLRGSRCRKPDNGNKIKDTKTDSNKTLSSSDIHHVAAASCGNALPQTAQTASPAEPPAALHGFPNGASRSAARRPKPISTPLEVIQNRIAKRIGPRGWEILLDVPAPELDQLSAMERAGTLTDTMLADLCDRFPPPSSRGER
jgi:hypothetical protein